MTPNRIENQQTKSGQLTKRACVQGVTVGSSEKRFLEA